MCQKRKKTYPKFKLLSKILIDKYFEIIKKEIQINIFIPIFNVK